MKRNIVLFLLWVLPITASAQSFKIESPDGSQVAEISAVSKDGVISFLFVYYIYYAYFQFCNIIIKFA